MEINERAKGKINLTLDIVGESRGFHLLDMLTATIDLCDDVKITYRSDETIECFQDGRIVDETNSAYRAAKLMKDTFKTHGFVVEITKRIPMSGGLGGSCADGVATVRGISKMLMIRESLITTELLLKVGSDAPSMYCDGIKRVRGIGEKVDLIDTKLDYKVGFIAGSGVNTAQCFQEYDKKKTPCVHSTKKLISAMKRGDFQLKKSLHNDLFLPATRLNPEISETYRLIEKSGAEATSMSGSGSAVYGLFSGDVPEFLTSASFSYRDDE